MTAANSNFTWHHMHCGRLLWLRRSYRMSMVNMRAIRLKCIYNVILGAHEPKYILKWITKACNQKQTQWALQPQRRWLQALFSRLLGSPGWSELDSGRSEIAHLGWAAALGGRARRWRVPACASIPACPGARRVTEVGNALLLGRSRGRCRRSVFLARLVVAVFVFLPLASECSALWS